MYPVLPLYEIKYQPFDKLRVETVAPLSLLVHQLSEFLQYYSYYKDHSVDWHPRTHLLLLHMLYQQTIMQKHKQAVLIMVS